jgi:hypothetical protein
MTKNKYFSVQEFADILGKAVRIGRSFAIPKEVVSDVLHERLGEKDKRAINEAVKKTFKEYGEVIRLLGKE